MDFPIGISLLVKVTVLLSVGLAASAAARGARAAVRHVILASTFAGLLVLPIAATVAPPLTVSVPAGVPGVVAPGILRGTAARQQESASAVADSPAAAGQPSSVERDEPARAASPMSGWTAASVWLTGIWAAGTIVVLLPLAASLWRVRRLRRTGLPAPEAQRIVEQLARRAGVHRPVAVLLHEGITAPLTSGVIRPAIVLPRDAAAWTADELRQAALHELEHIHRVDWWTQLAARALCAAWWWHPMVWVAWRRLGVESERACDDAVVADAESTGYAEQLLMLARRASASPQPMLSMAGRSDLSVRIAALLDDRIRRGRVGRLLATTVGAVVLLASLAISPLRAIAAPAVTADVATRAPMAEAPAALSGRTADGVAETIAEALSVVVEGAVVEGAAVGAAQGAASQTDVNHVFPGDGTRLIIAARSGDLQGARDLLDRGADPNLASPGDGNPLIMAAGRGDLALTRLLLDRGANIDGAVRGDGNPLIAAAGRGHLAAVRLLLDRGADVNAIVPGDENALIQASGAGHLEVVRLLVSRNADVNARVEAQSAFGGEVRTALRMAQRYGHRAVADYLRSVGAVD